MRDIHAQITNTVLHSLEEFKKNPVNFKLPWHKPGGGLPENTLTKRPYHGGNAIFLWFKGAGYGSKRWATYKQWQELDAQVRKGEKGVPILVPIQIKPKDIDINEETDEEGKMLRFIGRTVFNEDQVDDFVDPDVTSDIITDTITTLEKADELVTASGAVVNIGGTRAFYDLKSDKITMPDRERFIGSETMSATEGWYATLLHELVHWTGAESRLCRASFKSGEERNKSKYAFEELVAEFGSAFLAAHTGVTPTFREDHAQYIAHWIQVLQSDKKAFFQASTAAETAVEFLMAKAVMSLSEAA
jgi:antirestriction protein ArdC